jgi:hypothetical protein
LIIAI